MFRSPYAHVCIVHKEGEGIHRRVTSALVIPQRSIRCKRPVTYYWGGGEGRKKEDRHLSAFRSVFLQGGRGSVPQFPKHERREKKRKGKKESRELSLCLS